MTETFLITGETGKTSELMITALRLSSGDFEQPETLARALVETNAQTGARS